MSTGSDPRYGRPFTAPSTAVASPHELASVAGLGMLQQDGTAVDAMVAVNAALGVVYPHMAAPAETPFGSCTMHLAGIGTC